MPRMPNSRLWNFVLYKACREIKVAIRENKQKSEKTLSLFCFLSVYSPTEPFVVTWMLADPTRRVSLQIALLSTCFAFWKNAVRSFNSCVLLLEHQIVFIVISNFQILYIFCLAKVTWKGEIKNCFVYLEFMKHEKR